MAGIFCLLVPIAAAAATTAAHPEHHGSTTSGAASASGHAAGVGTTGARMARLGSIVQAVRTVRASQLATKTGTKSSSIANTPPRPVPSPGRDPREHPVGDPNSGGEDPSSGSGYTAGADQPGVQTNAVNPVNEAVLKVCGQDVTVCGVWWPTAQGNEDAYNECMAQHNSNDLDFGNSTADSCAAQFGGDCQGVTADGSIESDLCSLVGGSGITWPSDASFSAFVLSGDCQNFTRVLDRDAALAGIKLSDHPQKPSGDATATPSGVQVCVGKLFLRK
ncbi:MAG: hypothetical protein JO233_04610 [Candidatus Eremiobacteraeota bacterium]|nr:hypothetical protein [Candidatus Eremiobacteraeota bacterium]